jgi:phosphoribosylaminoimidazolecarboxamide formyltransferase/IMP cyclohydrolase
MTQDKDGLRPIRRALISVSDKTGIVDFARELKTFGVEIISTGGTARALREAGIEVRDVSDVTGFPEMMDGRIKTLHPKIHGALLGLRDKDEHVAAMSEQGIEPIDLVVVNLYPFEETIYQDDTTLEEAIEQIDIGGPAMIRSAAKNFRDVAVVVSAEAYAEIVDDLQQFDGAVTFSTRRRLAWSAFRRTAEYDLRISGYLGSHLRVAGERNAPGVPIGASFQGIYAEQDLKLEKIRDLRYGENPHQIAALFEFAPPVHFEERFGVAHGKLLSGKEMSFNNYVDADAAWRLVCEVPGTACTIIKHTNAAGCAVGNTCEEAYRRALATDPVSAFGGIVAFNQTVDVAAAQAVIEIFTEVIIAPGFGAEALNVFRQKKNLRVLSIDWSDPNTNDESLDYKRISGGMLIQTPDTRIIKAKDLRTVTRRSPSEKEIEDLLFAWTVSKHTKSNAIVYARDKQTVGVGAGQMSRVDSVKIGAMRAQLPIQGSVLASDAFFPFRDGLDEAAKHGITAVIQPGGSVRDEEVIAAANEHDLAMVFTGIRHFKH